MEGLLDGTALVGWLRFDLLARLLLATALGGAIGYERERSGKPAGLRTNILICVGAALITDLSVRFPGMVPGDGIQADPARLAAQIVSGVGFLGAGTIIQARGSVTGLTTAATLWVVAAIGMAVGTGSLVEAMGTTFLVLVILVVLGWLETHLLRQRSIRTVRLLLEGEGAVVDEIAALIEQRGLSVSLESADWDRSESVWVAAYEVGGPASRYEGLRHELLNRPEIKGYSVM